MSKETTPQFNYSDLTFVIDTREQRPWDFSEVTTPRGMKGEDLEKFDPPIAPKIIYKGLKTGDYTVETSLGSYESSLCIERKSVDDLLGCVGSSRSRFERELKRMLSFEARVVIVEASWDQVEFGTWRTKIHPSAVTGSIIGWMQWGIPFHFAKGSTDAAHFAARYMLMYARRKQKGNFPKGDET